MKPVKLLIIVLLCAGKLTAADVTTPPSPYYIHDTEVYFFDYYEKMMRLGKDSHFKFAFNPIITAQMYLFGVLLEAPVYKASKDSALTLLASMAYQGSGNGDPRLNFRTEENVGITNILGASWYSKNLFLRAGYIYGAYILDRYVYLDQTPSKIDALNDQYYNYRRKAHAEEYGLADLYKDPEIKYQRMLFDIKCNFDFIVLKALAVTNAKTAPSYSLTTFDVPLFNRFYTFSPYFSSTNDVEGIHPFKVYQFGIKQKLTSDKYRYLEETGRSEDSLAILYKYLQFTLDFNYTKIPETVLTEAVEDYYVHGELYLGLIAVSAWYNQDAGAGAGFGLNTFLGDSNMRVGIWTLFKYNSYIAAPLYKRSVNDKGYSWEFGGMMFI